MKQYIVNVTNDEIKLMLHREGNSFGDQILTLYCYHSDGSFHIPWAETNYEGEHVTINDKLLNALSKQYSQCTTQHCCIK